jgi:hypothetical protein
MQVSTPACQYRHLCYSRLASTTDFRGGESGIPAPASRPGLRAAILLTKIRVPGWHLRRAIAVAVPLALGGLLPAGCTHPTDAPTGTGVSVTVNAASIGNVGTGFVGLSYEKNRVGADLFDVHDNNLVNLFRLLGPGVLRIGGDSVDIVNWNANGAGGSAAEVASSDVTKLAAFLKATGWKVIYGINLKTNTPANAASEAEFAATALDGSLLSFSIGNEPGSYTTESSYEASFDSFAAAIRAAVPGAVFDGPEVAKDPSWIAPFAAHERSNGLVMLSMHAYIGKVTRAATISGMLASNPGSFSADETVIQRATSVNGIPQWRMTEANSYWPGGKNGVSNVEAAALWSLDFMYGIAAHGGAGVNFHSGPYARVTSYSPITLSGIDPTGVQAVYYGELLWKLAGPGALHPASVSGGSDITAWGIGHNVVVNNKSGASVTVSLKLVAPASSASAYVLTAPSLTSKAITIAGSGVSISGSFTPVPRPLAVSGASTSVTIPADSATLIVTR